MVAIPQILVVDDDPGVVGVLSALLKSEGYQVVCALGGEKAKEYLASGDFDLMISDIRMSPVDGLELLQIAHAEKPAMAAIMLTAFGSVETAIEALKFGAFDYITKPFKVDELLITVQRACDINWTISSLKARKCRMYVR
jgi:two-component system response regulator PilR (NtrC family)